MRGASRLVPAGLVGSHDGDKEACILGLGTHHAGGAFFGGPGSGRTGTVSRALGLPYTLGMDADATGHTGKIRGNA